MAAGLDGAGLNEAPNVNFSGNSDTPIETAALDVVTEPMLASACSALSVLPLL